MIFNFSGDGSPLYEQMLQTYASALAPGTYLNREKQARCYITFAVLYNVPYLSPSPVHVCMFSQYLANGLRSLASIKNYISGARTWIMEHGGSTMAFGGHEQSTMVKAISKDSDRTVHRALPITSEHLLKIVSYLDKARNAPACVKPCILVGFSCYLRSSNLVSPQLTVLGGPHTLLAKNVVDYGSELKVTVMSTKTKMTPYSLTVPVCNVQQLCPVRAWRAYRSAVRLNPNGPAFMLNSCTPLSAALVVGIMRDALSSEPGLDVKQISMHSIRRGAAQQAQKQGSQLSDIMSRGGWASKSGVKPYLTTNHSS